MRIDEVEYAITYSSGLINPVTPSFTRQFLDAHLYVDDPGRVFRKWWASPQNYFAGGGIFSVAHAEGSAVGVGVIRLPEQLYYYELPDGQRFSDVGQIGFFVKEGFRKQHIGASLSITLEGAFLRAFPTYKDRDRVPFVRCSRLGCRLVDQYFTTIITSDEANARVEKYEQNKSNGL